MERTPMSSLRDLPASIDGRRIVPGIATARSSARRRAGTRPPRATAGAPVVPSTASTRVRTTSPCVHGGRRLDLLFLQTSRGFGISEARIPQTTAAASPRTSASTKLCSLGWAVPPAAPAEPARTAATTAAAMLVPNARIKVFRPFAAPVSPAGTASIIRVGIAA